MRFRAYGCAAALTTFALVGCDSSPQVDNIPTNPDANTAAPASQSDALLTTQIQARYFASPDVKAHRIDVDTEGGVVTLEGTVDQDAERQAAEQIARDVSGVSRVNNQLVVRPVAGGNADAQRHHAPETTALRRDSDRTPGWITAKIQSQYYLNPELKPWRIDVDTSSAGVVTLTGTVDSESDRTEAVRVARATQGVTRVNDSLRIREAVATSGSIKDSTAVKDDAREVGDDARNAARSAADKIEDGWITMKIQSKYFLDDDVRARNIDVQTKDRMVTLTGPVQSEGERQHALSIARSTEGVTMVHDNLVVDRGTSNSRTDAGPQSDVGLKVDDAWITMKVQSKYFIHDEIKSRKVDVDTKNGVVTLSGAVPSDAAKNAAEVIAQDTEGVSKVINNLQVQAAS